MRIHLKLSELSSISKYSKFLLFINKCKLNYIKKKPVYKAGIKIYVHINFNVESYTLLYAHCAESWETI